MHLVLLFLLVTVSLACPQGESDGYYKKRGYKRGYSQGSNYYRNRENYQDGEYYNNDRGYENKEEYQSIEDNSNDPCSTPKTVAQFNKYFADEVRDSEQLTSVFNCAKNLTREEMKAAIFFTDSIFEESSFKKPSANALNTIQDIVTNCKKISPVLLLSIYSNSAGKVILGGKKMTSATDAKLRAKTFASDIIEVADAMASEDCPRSKIFSIIQGFNTLLRSQGLYSDNNIGNASRIFSNEWKCQDKNANLNKKCRIASFSPGKPALKECNNVCKMNNKSIEKFVNAFSLQVKNCANLTELFKVEPSVSPSMFSRGTYYVDLYYSYASKPENRRGLADFQSRFIRKVKDLNPTVLERVHSQFLAKYLLSEKVLNCENAEKLAEMWADITKNKSNRIVDNKTQATKIVAIQVSWRKFLQSLDLFSADKYANISFLYGNQWRCQT